jgi:hypothetical protein
MKDTFILDPDEGPSPGSPEFNRFARLDVLVRGGVEAYRELLHEDPPADLVAEATPITARLAILHAPRAASIP